MAKRKHIQGFTLIELSIVLVVIGLIVGGILVGQSLINAAGERATVAQIEKYNTAANTFYGKYGYLPGDIPSGPAAQFGLAPRGTALGQGDGNGVLEGSIWGIDVGYIDSGGETLMFWSDLSYANGMNLNLIDGSFTAASSTGMVTVTGTGVASYFPAAKLGNGNYIYVYGNTGAVLGSVTSVNYIGLSAVTGIGPTTDGCDGCLDSKPGLTVKQAFDIDTKIDDGLPTTGNVTVRYVGGNDLTTSPWITNAPSAAADSATTCYNTGNNKYSLSSAAGYGANVNCALSFKMQAGD